LGAPHRVITSDTEAHKFQENQDTRYRGLVDELNREIILGNNDKSQNSSEENLVPIQTVREYLAILWQMYQGANKPRKTEILDEIVRNLKVHRSTAKRHMSSKGPPKLEQGKNGGRKDRYSKN